MSGSNSSSRGAAGEALSFTVHAMPSPTPSLPRGGRLTMLLLALACLAPVLASYFTYYVLRPAARTNYSTLISPSRSLPELALRALDGTAAAAPALKGQWLLVVVGDAACAADCERQLYLQRQLREMLGRERERVDKVWFVTGPGTPTADLQAAVSPAAAPLTMLRIERAALARWLEPAPGHALEDHVYIVDPMGEWMMRAPAGTEPARLKRDLDRLLRASSSWDQPGR